MTLDFSPGLVFAALMLLAWPMVVFASARFVRRRPVGASLMLALGAGVVSIFVGIAVADAVAMSRYRAAGAGSFFCYG
jgi:hypothetical protein